MIGEGGELIVYRSEDGRTHVQLRAVEGTVWLQMAQLYHTSVQNVGQIIRRILDDGEVTQATINSAERYSELEQRRRDEEAERAVLEEWDDLRALTAIERGRPDQDEEEP